MKKTKRFLLVFMLIVTAAALSLCVGCKKKGGVAVKAEFKANAVTDIPVGSSIDIEDYIVKIDGADYTVEITYFDKAKNENVTERPAGVTFYTKYAGEHTMKYTVTSGKNSDSAELKLNVYGSAPEISISSAPVVYSEGDTVAFAALLNVANPLVNPVNASLKIKSVVYGRETLTLEKTIEEGTSYEKTFTDETQFEFDKVGTYVFTVEAQSEYGTSTANFRAEVVPEEVTGPDLLQDNGKAVAYNAEVSGNTVRLIQSEDLANASYVALDTDYGENDIFRIEFKGRNCPNISLLSSFDDSAIGNKYSIYSGKGYVFSFEHSYVDKFSIYGGEKLSGRNNHNGNNNTGYFGYNDFDPEKYYGLELRVKSYSASAAHNQGSLWVCLYTIENYGTADYSYTPVYTAAVGWHNDTSALKSGKVMFYGSKKDNIVFKYYKPVGNVLESTMNYDSPTRTLTWTEVPGAVYYVSTDNVNYTFQKGSSYTVDDFLGSTTIYVKSSVGVNTFGESVSKSVTVLPDYMTDMNVSMASATINQNRSITLKKGTINGAQYAISSTSMPYFAFDGNYGVGDYVAFEFTGRDNFPQLAFFAQGYGMDLTQGKGIYLDNNLSDANDRGPGVLRYRFTLFGPDMLKGGGTTSGKGSGGCRYDPFFRKDYGNDSELDSAGLSYNSLSDTVKYRYIVGFENNADIDGRIIIRILLQNAETGETVADKYLSIAHALDTLSGSIVAYGNSNNEVTFKYYAPTAETTDDITLSYNDATKTLTWDEVANAEKYYVMTESKVLAQVAGGGTLSYTFEGGIPVYYNSVRVVAITTDNKTTQSNTVAVDTSTFTKTSDATVVYNADGTLTATLPFVDRGSLTGLNYIASKESYTAGSNYVRLDFKGKNYPGHIVFAVDSPSQTRSEMKGFGLDLDNYKWGGFWFTKSDNTVPNNVFQGDLLIYTDPDVSNNIYTYMHNDKPDCDFVLIAGTVKNPNLRIEYKLYEKTADGALKLIADCFYMDSQSNQLEDAAVKKIYVANAGKHRGNDTKFTMHMPDTYENVMAKLNQDYPTINNGEPQS